MTQTKLNFETDNEEHLNNSSKKTLDDRPDVQHSEVVDTL